MDSSRFSMLQAAYIDTDYKVLLGMGEHFVLRVGEHSAAADDLLMVHDAETGAFITPENPFSEQLTDEENYQRCVAFERTLASAGHTFLHGTGQSRDATWPGENSYFILSLTEPEAVKLARTYAQNAFIMYDRGSPARLVWTGSAPHRQHSELPD